MKPTREYIRVGSVERWSKSKRSYTWRNGYAPAESPGQQPWMTRAEARAEAKRDGFKAVFIEGTST